MTADHTHGSTADDGAGDALWYARTLIEDAPQYDDASIKAACKVVIRHSPCAGEIARAQDLLTLTQGPDHGSDQGPKQGKAA